MSITAVGIDIGKNCFHLHALHDDKKSVTRKKLSRMQLYALIANLSPTIIAMGACGGAHFLARKFQGDGHTI